jgi:hypothetical protein
MRFPRLPYWLVSSAIVLALLAMALRRRETADSPPAPPPLPEAEGQVLAQAAPIDPSLVVRATPLPGRRIGAAFSVADAGVWLTARRIVDGCAAVAVLVGDGEGVEGTASIAPAFDVAVLRTKTGAPALPIASQPPQVGALVFAAGSVDGRPAEVATRLEGFERRYRPGRARRMTAMLVLAEIGRTEGLKGSLAGLAGGPALDAAGRVVGVILGDAPRRGRLYAAPPEDIAAALAAAGAAPAPQAAGLALTTDNYGLAADVLRRALRIAPAACVSPLPR